MNGDLWQYADLFVGVCAGAILAFGVIVWFLDALASRVISAAHAEYEDSKMGPP